MIKLAGYRLAPHAALRKPDPGCLPEQYEVVSTAVDTAAGRSPGDAEHVQLNEKDHGFQPWE